VYYLAVILSLTMSSRISLRIFTCICASMDP
jgi:hypothetical protein